MRKARHDGTVVEVVLVEVEVDVVVEVVVLDVLVLVEVVVVLVEEVVEVVEEVLVVGGRVVEVVVNAVMVVVVDDVVGGAVVVVVVVVKLTEVVVAKVTVVVVVVEGLPLSSWQRSSQATVPGGSHSSPPPKSTIPSPHSESLALKDIFSFPRRARSVPVIVLQVGSILALRRTLPLRPSHEGQTALTLVPVLASVIFPEVLRQPLVREILIPSMTTASGSPSGVALMSGGPSTRKRPLRHAGAASARTQNEPRRPVARATASSIDAFIRSATPLDTGVELGSNAVLSHAPMNGKNHAASALAVLSTITRKVLKFRAYYPTFPRWRRRSPLLDGA